MTIHATTGAGEDDGRDTSDGGAVSRRNLFTTVAAVGVGGSTLAACNANGSSGAAAPKPTAPVTLGKTSDVPVGGGFIYTDERVVVTQPTAGTYKGFSAVCTHQGCLVNQVSDGLITCPCHGSQYSIADGSVQGGPAPSPLPAVAVTVQGTTIVEQP